MLTRIKIYFQLLVNQSISKTSETTNGMIFTETKILVHFYKKIPGHHHHFPWLSMTLAVFHDFPGSVVTLQYTAGQLGQRTHRTPARQAAGGDESSSYLGRVERRRSEWWERAQTAWRRWTRSVLSLRASHSPCWQQSAALDTTTQTHNHTHTRPHSLLVLTSLVTNETLTHNQQL